VTSAAFHSRVRAEAPQDVFYDNPFDYCHAVGDIDTPDGRYVSPGQTPEMVNAIADAWAMPPDAEFRRLPPTLTWRCMEGRVYVCTYGANIQCNAKANFDTQPTDTMSRWCEAPQMIPVPKMPVFVPAYVAGRTTAYSWVCQEGRAVSYGEPAPVDAQGYFKRFWYLVVD
jgi:hypothetical protein